MINNRPTGRRRGRGGSRPNTNTNRGPNDGSRLDSRARGNAHQLLEKYKAMARDAQNQGDRVVQEYYLQFADHYFRILSEANARSDDQRRQREGARHDNQDGEDSREGGGAQAEPSADREGNGERQPSRAPRGGNGARESRADARDADERIEVDRLPAAIIARDDREDDDDAAARTNSRPRRSRARPPKPDEAEGTTTADA